MFVIVQCRVEMAGNRNYATRLRRLVACTVESHLPVGGAVGLKARQPLRAALPQRTRLVFGHHDQNPLVCLPTCSSF